MMGLGSEVIGQDQYEGWGQGQDLNEGPGSVVKSGNRVGVRVRLSG